MKNLFIVVLFTMASVSVNAQDKIGEICKWDFDKKCAVALTFDDWLTTHPTIVVPALQERGMTATFYVITKDLNQYINSDKERKYDSGLISIMARLNVINNAVLSAK